MIVLPPAVQSPPDRPFLTDVSTVDSTPLGVYILSGLYFLYGSYGQENVSTCTVVILLSGVIAISFEECICKNLSVAQVL